MSTLVLFDIDGTLVLTGGAGGRAVTRTLADLFTPDACQPPPLAGRTDRWIFTEALRSVGVEADAVTLDRVREVYLTHLMREIVVTTSGQRVLPGVHTLLDTLAATPDVSLGLLTGNVAAGARIKLERFGLWRYFAGGGFGDTSLERTALYHDAVAEMQRTTGTTFTPADTVLIGDTPLDIAVALDTGARSVGVATGGYSTEDLRRAGADDVFEDLSDLTHVLKALGVAAST